MPRVRFVNRVFPPAEGATGLYLHELASSLAAQGWTVEVVTGPAPDAPAEAVLPSGVRVRRLAGAPARKGAMLRRAVGYATLLPRLAQLARRGPRPDVIVLKTDPPLLLLAGPWLRRRTGAAIIHWAQDVYPEVAEAIGVVRPGGVAARVLRRLAARALRQYDAVVTVGRCMAERILAAGVPPDRVAVVPNWAPSSVRPVPPAENPFRRDHGLDGRFVVMYSGNFGLAHPFDAILDAAERLATAAPDVLVVLIGDGARRAWIETEIDRRAFANVRILPFQPVERLAESLSAADLHVVTMEHALEGLVVPSKVYGALAAGRPVVFLGPAGSEAARLITEAEAGTVLTEASGATLAAAVLDWAREDAARTAAGVRAAAAVSNGRMRASDAFEECMRRALKPSSATSMG